MGSCRGPFAAILCAAFVSAVLPISAQAAARWVQELPPSFINAPYVFDSQRQRVIVLNDTTQWALSSDPVPQWSVLRRGDLPALGCTYVYDPALDRIWAFTSTQGTVTVTPGKLFYMELGAATLTWTPQVYSGSAPSRLGSYAYIYDPPRHRIVLWGGSTPAGVQNYIAVLNLDGTPSWTYPSALGTPPSGRNIPKAVYDPVRDRMVVYGGVFPFPQVVYDETWALSLGSPMQWTFLTPSPVVAPARYDHAMVLDAERQRALVIGGVAPGLSNPPAYHDTWALDLSLVAPPDTARWSRLPDPVTHRLGGFTWIDSVHSRLVRSHGTGVGGGRRYEISALALDDPPAWSLVTHDSLRPPARVGHVAFAGGTPARWFTALGTPAEVWGRTLPDEMPWSVVGSGDPGVRYWAGAVNDEAGGQALVFGGTAESEPNATSTEYNDLWAFGFSSSAWTPLAPPSPPPVRADALTIFDTLRRRMIVHGGRAWQVDRTRPRADTWAYDVVANTWSSLPVGGYGGRWAQAGIYDPLRDRIVAFGGRDTLVNYSDVHVLPLGAPGNWGPLATSGTAPVVSRPGSSRAAYDPLGDRMIVLNAEANHLRAYALTLGATPTWSPLELSGSPPPARENFAFTVHAATNRLMVAQGRDISLTPTGVPTQDVWLLYLDETTPALASLVSTSFAAGRVRVVWQLSSGIGSVRAERRNAGGEWISLGRLDPDGTRRVELTDGDVTAGVEYAYRIRDFAGGEVLGEARIVVPNAGALSLAIVSPNPATGPLRTRFTLPRTGPAEIELFDVTGHRVLRQPVGHLGAGTHSMELRGERSTLAPGLYFLQLSQAGIRRQARVAVLR